MITEMATMVGLAVTSVGLWTLRVALAATGRKLVCAGVAALEALVFVLTFSRLVADLGTPARLLGYVLGVTVGSVVGLMLNERLSTGHSELALVAPGERPDLAEWFHGQGHPATWSAAAGPNGPVTMIWLTLPDRELPLVTDRIEAVAPGAFWTVQPKATVVNVDPVVGR